MKWEPRSEYGKKLQDPRWQKVRLKILERDNWTCQGCGAKDKTLHVHHVAYKAGAEGPWDVDESLLCTLCADCHEQEGFTDFAYMALLILGRCDIRCSTDLVLFIRMHCDNFGQPYPPFHKDPDLWRATLARVITEFPASKHQRIEDGTWFSARLE